MQEAPGLFNPGISCFIPLPASTVKVCTGHPGNTDNTGHYLQRLGAFAGIWELLSIHKPLSISFYQKAFKCSLCGQCSPLDKSNEDMLHQGRTLNG